MSTAPSNPTFPSLLMTVIKHVPLVAGLMIAAGACVYLFGSASSPRYISESQVLVEIQDDTYTRSTNERGSSASATAVDNAAIRSQVQLLQSYDLAAAVVDQLALTELAEFDPLLKGQSLTSRLLVALGLKRNPARMTAQERVIDSYLDSLSVFPVDESRVITVRFRSKDPQLPAKVINTLLDEYLRVQREAKQATTRDATTWLSGQIEDLRARVAEAEKKVADYRSEAGLLVGQNNATLSAQQLSELNSQLIIAQTQKSEAQVRAQSIRALLASGQPIDSSADVLESQLLGRLQERLISIRSRRSELLATLLPGHPRIREIDAEISGLRTQIRDEMRKIASALESESDLAGAREASLRANLEALKAQVSDTTESTVRLSELEREAKAQRDLLESLLARFREASARQDPNAAAPDARIISRPVASNMPASPELGILMIAAMIMTGLIATGIVVMRYLLKYATSGVADIGHPIYIPPTVRPASVRPEHDGAMDHSEMHGRVAGGDGDEHSQAASVSEPQFAEETGPAPSLPPLERKGTGVREPETVGTIPAHFVQDEPAADSDETGPNSLFAPADTDAAREASAAHPAGTIIRNGDEMRAAIASAARADRKTSIIAAPEANGVSRSVAVALARSLAKDDLRVVVVDVNDTDTTSRQSGAGLRALLSGRARFAHVIQRDKTSNVHVIGADRGPLVSDFANSERFSLVLDALRQTYDAVILAASPVAGSSQTAALASRSDMAVLIAVEERASETRDRARDLLLASGCPEVLTYVPDGAGNTDRTAKVPETAA